MDLNESVLLLTDPLTRVKLESRHDKDLDDEDDLDDDIKDEDLMGHHHSQHMHLGHHGHHMIPCLKDELKNDCGIPIPATKPKIWSLADTAACKTPPPPSAQPWPASGGNFALPNSAMSPAGPTTPYSRYSGFLGHYNNTFPEVQTDTPPQTPPNMKLPNLVNSNGCVQQNGYQQGFPNAYARMPHQQQSMGAMSPHNKERQEFPMQSNMRHSALTAHHQQLPPSHHNNNNNPESTAFKPFFKG